MMYRVNRNPDRPDVIHVEHPFEECNFDDAQDREFIDHEIAWQQVAEGKARYCGHCLPEGIVE